MRLTILTAVLAAAILIPTILGAPSSTKIGLSLQQVLESNNQANIIISLREKTSTVLNQFDTQRYKSRADRSKAVAAVLKEFSATSQKNVLKFLSTEPEFIVTSLWVSNQIAVKGASQGLIHDLLSFDEVSEINLDEEFPLEKPVDSYLTSAPDNSLRAEWGVVNIEAPRAWDAGFTGEGVVIATVDTGVRVSHEALAINYVGAERNGWYDPYQKTEHPNDQNGHGTHTTSNIAGSHGVGVAHGSRWMACKGCATSSCTNSALIECGQFMICPTKFDGTGDCADSPAIVSNSWGGGRGNLFYNDVIDAYHVAGIIPVFSIGNTGPSCATARSPGEQNVIGVGATTSNNELAYFSSKGPSMYGDHDIKPNVAAPGASVRSAYHTSDNAYAVLSGTSMAAPHAAGVVALIVQAYPEITFEEAKQVLYAGADTHVVPTGQTCGGIPDNEFPNNSFGRGKVNAYKSVMEALKSAKQK